MKDAQKQNPGVMQNKPAKMGNANKIATGQKEPKFVQSSEKHGTTSIPMEEVQMSYNKLTEKDRGNMIESGE